MGTCDSVLPLLECIGDNLRWLAITLIKLKFAHKLAQVFHRLATQRKLVSVLFSRALALANKTPLKWLFCNWRLICAYSQVRHFLATEHKSVCASWYFQTCDDLSLALAKAFKPVTFPEPRHRIPLLLISRGGGYKNNLIGLP